MIVEGVKLMFIGMTTVLLFLTMMIFMIDVVSRLTKKYAARELENIRKERLQRVEKASRIIPMHEDTIPIAVIVAAIAAYEADQYKTW